MNVCITENFFSFSEYGTVKIPIPANAYKPVCGFLGTIKLISGLYLVVAKYRILVSGILF